MYNCDMKQQSVVAIVMMNVVKTWKMFLLVLCSHQQQECWLVGWETVTWYSYTFTHMIYQGLLHQPGKGPTPTCEANDCLLNRPDFYTEQDKLLA